MYLYLYLYPYPFVSVCPYLRLWGSSTIVCLPICLFVPILSAADSQFPIRFVDSSAAFNSLTSRF